MAEQSWDGGGQPFVLRLVEEVGGRARELAGVSLLALSVPEKAAALEGIAAAVRALEAAHVSVVRALAGTCPRWGHQRAGDARAPAQGAGGSGPRRRRGRRRDQFCAPLESAQRALRTTDR